MRTIAYIDGYNLFYGLIKHSNYKWLDLYTLFSREILKPQSPQSHLNLVKYFTAPIKPKFASRGQKALEDQLQYHRALESSYTGNIQIFNGYYSAEKATPMSYIDPPDKTQRVMAWKLEEKQTDVSMAVELYRDVAKGQADQVVVCTSDTDIAPVISAIKEDFPEVKVGCIFPRFNSRGRPAPKTLTDLADWTRHYINEQELARSQLPEKVPTKKKPIFKPEDW